jgi:hypothetical protein
MCLRSKARLCDNSIRSACVEMKKRDHCDSQPKTNVLMTIMDRVIKINNHPKEL